MPGAQPQLVAPLVAVGAFPAGHERQRSKPLAPWCFPAAHGVHSAAAALVWFCGPNLPGVQLLPVQDAEPAAPLYVPDGHGVQPPEPLLLLCAPAGHGVHSAVAALVWRDAPNLPAAHRVPPQVLSLWCALFCPGAQGVQGEAGRARASAVAGKRSHHSDCPPLAAAHIMGWVEPEGV